MSMFPRIKNLSHPRNGFMVLFWTVIEFFVLSLYLQKIGTFSILVIKNNHSKVSKLISLFFACIINIIQRIKAFDFSSNKILSLFLCIYILFFIIVPFYFMYAAYFLVSIIYYFGQHYILKIESIIYYRGNS